MKSIGKRIQLVRNILGISRAAMGVKLGLCIDDMSDIEEGRKQLEPFHIQYICKEYGVRLEWLENGTGEMMLNNTDISENHFKLYMEPFFRSCMEEAEYILENDTEYQKENSELEKIFDTVVAKTTFKDVNDLLSQCQAVANVENQMMFTLGLRYGMKFAKMLGVQDQTTDCQKARIMNMRKFII